MDLVARKLESLSSITHTVQGVFDGKRDTLIQVVSFSGEYQVGSKGGKRCRIYARGCISGNGVMGCSLLDIGLLSPGIFLGLRTSWSYRSCERTKRPR